MMYSQDYLAHYGVLGMRWGHRTIARSEAGLRRLDSGKHISVGFGQKRQKAYDSRDRKILESRIVKTKKSLDDNEKRDMAKLKDVGSKAATSAKKALAFREQHTYDTNSLGPNIKKVYMDDPRLVAKAEKADSNVNRLMAKLNKKYKGTVSASFIEDAKTGKRYVDLMLGNQTDKVEID